MPAIDTVIFDLGRVMVSIDPCRPKFAGLMRAIGVAPEEAFARFWRAPEVIAHNTGEISSERFYQLVRDRFGLSLTWPEFAEAWSDLFEPVPGMEELFTRVAAIRKVGILSDTDPLHWERARRILPCLDRAVPTLSYIVGAVKPDPAMYRAAAANCATPPERCLFIDDLEGNVRGAREAGMVAIRFTSAEALRSELSGNGIAM